MITDAALVNFLRKCAAAGLQIFKMTITQEIDMVSYSIISPPSVRNQCATPRLNFLAFAQLPYVCSFTKLKGILASINNNRSLRE